MLNAINTISLPLILEQMIRRDGCFIVKLMQDVFYYFKRRNKKSFKYILVTRICKNNVQIQIKTVIN